jgi:hypothetical protein
VTSMNPLPESEPFCLEAPPNELWPMERMTREFGVPEKTIHAWVKTGKLPRPWCKRRGKSCWAPEQLQPALRRHRQQ